MATLEIRKKSNKVWQHVSSDLGTYIVSKLYCKTNGNTFKIVEHGGSRRGEYDYSDVTVYDIGGGSETFVTPLLLMQRLEQLGYVGFIYDGEVLPADLISTDASNNIVVGTDGGLFSSGGGGSTDSVKKSDFLTNAVTQTGANISIPLKANGANLYLLGAGVTSVKGFNLSEIVEMPFENKPFRIKNFSGVDVTLEHNGVIDVPLVFNSGANIIIPNNEEIEFRFTSGGMGEVFKSWSEGGGVLETKNKLITIPLGDLGVDIEDVTYEMVSDYITNLGLTIEKGENYYFEVIKTYNFDLTSPKWTLEGVTDEASFINWLETRSYNDLTNVVITDFNFIGDRIFCNMTADGTFYNLASLGLVNTDKIGVVNGLTILVLADNQTEVFNPTIPLPSSLTNLSLESNQMTLAGYTASEVWANAQPAFTNPCNVYFSDNIDSISGTNLEAILLTKNCVISA